MTKTSHFQLIPSLKTCGAISPYTTHQNVHLNKLNIYYTNNTAGCPQTIDSDCMFLDVPVCSCMFLYVPVFRLYVPVLILFLVNFNDLHELNRLIRLISVWLYICANSETTFLHFSTLNTFRCEMLFLSLRKHTEYWTPLLAVWSAATWTAVYR
jgi:hypothetical protein